MNPALARLLVRLYPRAWRARYGEEFEAMLLDGQDGLRAGLGMAANVLGSALRESIFPTQRGSKVVDPTHSFGAIVRHPSAFMPMAMSLAGLSLVLGHILLFGVTHEADEGSTAHLWQLLMGLQLPVLAWFAGKWLPRAPRPALYILGLQAIAAMASMAPVLYFNL